MSDAIRTERLTKTYPGGVTAVDAVDLAIRSGEVFGLLGPNGAGKTTLTSVLATLLRPTSGRAEVDGVDVLRNPNAVRRRIGLVFQRSTADGTLTGRENLEIAAGLNGLRPSESRVRIDELLHEMGLAEAARRRASTYSGGMQRRLEIAVALVHSPSTLFLDEPTLGLDPQGRARFWEFLAELRRRHPVTILLTTHYLEEADRLCNRLAILDAGRVRAMGSPVELKARLGRETVVLEVDGPVDPVAARLRDVSGVAEVEPDGARTIMIRSNAPGTVVPSIVRACDAARTKIVGLRTRHPTLDEVFFSVTGRVYHEDSGPAEVVEGGA